MHRKQVRAAARTAALGGTLVLGLGSAQAAMAGSPVTVHVACYAGALASAISGATSGETIALAPGCVYHLDAALPDIGVDLTIVGYDTELLRDYGAPSFSLLSVDDDVDLTVVNVDFKNGGGPDNSDGGAIYSDGAGLTVQGGICTNNNGDDGDADGGAIYSDSTLTVTGAYFIENYAEYEGGAIYSEDGATISGSTFEKNATDDDYGGAIYNDDDMWLTGSTFTENVSYEGGAVYNDSDLTMDRDTLTGNAAYYNGGGIYNDWHLTVDGSLIDFNRASNDGGGIYNDDDIALAGDRIYGNEPDNCAFCFI
jgi:predicted outer membrane repeat protein